MNCPNCHTENPPNAKFCFNCGTALNQRCANCQSELPGGARFCPNCGQPVGASTAAEEQRLSQLKAATPADLRAQVVQLQEQAWPSEPGSEPCADAPTHDQALRPLSMVLVDEGTVLAALDILFKEIVHGGRRFAAGGLSTVVTNERARGRGYGGQLVSAAREEMLWELFTSPPPE